MTPEAQRIVIAMSHQEQQRRAIAEACGYTNVRRCSCNPDGRKEWLSGTRSDGVDVGHIKDYLNDANAALEFAKQLASEGWRCVATMEIDGNWRVTFLHDNGQSATTENTTLALAICEAGLKAKGLYKE